MQEFIIKGRGWRQENSELPHQKEYNLSAGEVLLGLRAGLHKPWNMVVLGTGLEGQGLGITLSSGIYLLPYCGQIS